MEYMCIGKGLEDVYECLNGLFPTNIVLKYCKHLRSKLITIY